MTSNPNNAQSFWQRSNDLQRREWRYRITRFLRATLRHWGVRMLALADEPRSFGASRRGWDTDHFVRLQRWHDSGFRPRVVYDIGAHTGLWSEMCHALFAPRQLFLFEPQPELQRQAEARGRKNGAAEWHVLPIALGSRDETQAMYVTENRAASSMLAPLPSDVPDDWGTAAVGRTDVTVMPLDKLVTTRRMPLPDLVKIDVQGFEGEVIAGGSDTLRQAQRLIIEVSLRPIYGGQALLPEILQTVSSWGFELEDMNDACREWTGRLWQTDLWLKRKT